MPQLILTDSSLHAILLDDPVAQALKSTGDDLRASLVPEAQMALLEIGRHQALDPAWPDPDSVIRAIWRICPGNLAERLTEALVVYRAFALWIYPPLLRLGHRLAEAEMSLYTKLSEKGKPYRDHLAHSTRDAALAMLLLFPREVGGLPNAAPMHELAFQAWLDRWPDTPEFHLLRMHAIRAGLLLSDPASAEGREEWTHILQGALLLASLAHDLGYVHKSLSERIEKVAALGPILDFPLETGQADDLDRLPLQQFHQRLINAGHRGARCADLYSFLSSFHREVHSLVGAIYLATIPARLPIDFAPWVSPKDSCAIEVLRARSRFEMACHLASLLAFAHDLALRDKADRKQLGFSNCPVRGQEFDVLNFECFPACTVYALCDVLQEFGRPIRTAGTYDVRYVVPMAGIRLTTPRSAADPTMLQYLVSDEDNEFVTKDALDRREWGGWSEKLVGNGVREWLERAGLASILNLDTQRTGLLSKDDRRYLPPAVRHALS